MAYTQTWLEYTTRARGLLVVATAYNATSLQEQVLYWSTMGFNTVDGTVFNPIIATDVKIGENMSLDGSISMTYGDIELLNPNGELDDYLDNTKWIWSNRGVKIYYGDPSWKVTSVSQLGDANPDTFELIYDGIIDDCKSRSRGVVNIVLRDKLERLNVPVTENTIGVTGTWSGGQTNQDTIRPLIFGEVYNVTPVLVDPSNLRYRFNDGDCEGLLEIRDNGFPVWYSGDLTGATVTASTGLFSLARPPSGVVTCSVQGVKTTWSVSAGGAVSATYINNIPDVIRLLVTSYGTAGKQLSAAEIDNASFKTVLDSFGTSTPACGYAVVDRINLLQMVQELAASIGCQVYMNRKGVLRLLRLGVTGASTFTIQDRDIVKGSLSVYDKSEHLAAVKLAYCKNWTIQQNLATLIPDSSKTDMAEEWLIKTVTDASTLSLYRLTSDPPQRTTYLITTESAQREAQRLLDYYKIQRTVYSFTASSRCIGLNLGDTVTIQHNRFGLQNGKPGQVIGISPQWSKGLVDLEVIV